MPLLDIALARVAGFGLSGPARVAVNAWYLSDQVVAAVGDRAHLSVESTPQPLGTAGGLGALRDWIGGRPRWLPGRSGRDGHRPGRARGRR